jgi:hypothetical protein
MHIVGSEEYEVKKNDGKVYIYDQEGIMRFWRGVTHSSIE